MYRSIMHAAAAAFIAVIASGCAKDVTSIPPVAATDSAAANFTLIGRPPVFDKNGFVEISAGYGFTCARRNMGAVYCWGRNKYGQTGQSTTDTLVVRPTQVFKQDGSPITAVQIDAGAEHACAREASGLAFCWGNGNSGQLGVAPGVFGSFQPSPVHGGIAFTSISAGVRTTCGTSNSGFFCWGADVGQGFATPHRLSASNTYGAVTVGELHACAMDNNDPNRTVDCFGANGDGQTGLPTSFTDVPFTLRAQFGTPITRVTTQGKFTCVDQNAGTVQCVGLNAWGRLGNGHANATNGVPTNIFGNPQLRGVTVGVNHACALAPDNTARCWGYGYDGQLGIGPNIFGAYAQPQPVYGNYTYRAIAAGSQHSCAIGTDGKIYCWGYNEWGALGRGSADFYAYNPPKPTDGP